MLMQDKKSALQMPSMQMKIRVPEFKKFIFDKKEITQTRTMKMNTDKGSASWLFTVGCKTEVQRKDDVCYAKLCLMSLQPSYTKPFFVYYSFGLMDHNGSVDFMTDVVKASTSDLVSFAGSKIDVITREKLMANRTRFIVDDFVTIVCQINIGGTDESGVVPSNITHIERMFCDGILTDVVITTPGDGIIRAHKCVLARSPVFYAMFQNETLEKQKSEVHVNNIEHSVMKELVRFMYTDKVESLDLIAGDLLIAADYYDLPELKRICLKSLESNIDLNNFVYSLHISEKLEIKSLQDAVLKFVVGNRKNIRKSPAFAELSENRELYQIILGALMDF